MLNATQRGFARLHRQRGVVLFIALIVLVVMSLAGIALMRSVGTGVLIAGNLGVKQATTSAGDLGVEAGRDWLVKADPSALANDAVASGYISYWQLEVDPSNPPNSSWWKDNAVLVNVAGTPYKDYDVRYVVHRMCKVKNMSVNDSTQSCVVTGALQGGSQGPSMGGLDYQRPPSTSQQVYYRVTVRVLGPKSTVSYVQTLLY